MATLFNVDGAAKPVAASEKDPATIFNVSGGRLYYGNAGTVNEQSTTSIENGESVEVTTATWVAGSHSAPVKVQVLRNADRD